MRRAMLRDVYDSSFTAHDSIIERHWSAWRIRGRAAYLRALLRSVEVGAAVDDRLQAIRVPTRVVHGKNEWLVPFRIAQHLASRIPGAELIALERTGHAPHLEEPAAVRAAIRAALAD